MKTHIPLFQYFFTMFFRLPFNKLVQYCNKKIKIYRDSKKIVNFLERKKNIYGKKEQQHFNRDTRDIKLRVIFFFIS